MSNRYRQDFDYKGRICPKKAKLNTAIYEKMKEQTRKEEEKKKTFEDIMFMYRTQPSRRMSWNTHYGLGISGVLFEYIDFGDKVYEYVKQYDLETMLTKTMQILCENDGKGAVVDLEEAEERFKQLTMRDKIQNNLKDF